MIQLHQFVLSGHCHKIRMMLNLLGLAHELVDLQSARGEHKSAEFLAMNPFGQVPVLVDGDVVLRDSQAILFYLAQRYGQGRWMPEDPAQAAAVMAWLSVAGWEIGRGPGMLRMHHKFGRDIDLAQSERITAEVLTILDAHLATREWLVGSQATIADVAVYPYIALAPEGRVNLAAFAHVLRWVQRVRSELDPVGMEGMVPIQRAA